MGTGSRVRKLELLKTFRFLAISFQSRARQVLVVNLSCSREHFRLASTTEYCEVTMIVLRVVHST